MNSNKLGRCGIKSKVSKANLRNSIGSGPHDPAIDMFQVIASPRHLHRLFGLTPRKNERLYAKTQREGVAWRPNKGLEIFDFSGNIREVHSSADSAVMHLNRKFTASYSIKDQTGTMTIFEP